MSIKSLVVLAAVLGMGACSTWGPTDLCYIDEQTQSQICPGDQTASVSDFGSLPVIVETDE